jgi:hypothetical protein
MFLFPASAGVAGNAKAMAAMSEALGVIFMIGISEN